MREKETEAISGMHMPSGENLWAYPSMHNKNDDSEEVSNKEEKEKEDEEGLEKEALGLTSIPFEQQQDYQLEQPFHIKDPDNVGVIDVETTVDLHPVNKSDDSKSEKEMKELLKDLVEELDKRGYSEKLNHLKSLAVMGDPELREGEHTFWEIPSRKKDPLVPEDVRKKMKEKGGKDYAPRRKEWQEPEGLKPPEFDTQEAYTPTQMDFPDRVRIDPITGEPVPPVGPSVVGKSGAITPAGDPYTYDYVADGDYFVVRSADTSRGASEEAVGYKMPKGSVGYRKLVSAGYGPSQEIPIEETETVPETKKPSESIETGDVSEMEAVPEESVRSHIEQFLTDIYSGSARIRGFLGARNRATQRRIRRLGGVDAATDLIIELAGGIENLADYETERSTVRGKPAFSQLEQAVWRLLKEANRLRRQNKADDEIMSREASREKRGITLNKVSNHLT